ncbi:hypothetical protein [Flindersiella endophytica]
MAIISLCSVKGAPGVTTTAVALTMAWRQPVLLVEADPAGGEVLAGYLRAELVDAQDLLDFARKVKRGAGERELWASTLPLDFATPRFLLPGLANPATQASMVSTSWDRIANALAGLTYQGRSTDIIVDCGRVAQANAPLPLLRTSDVIAVVAANRLPSVTAVHRHLSALRHTASAHSRVPRLCVLAMRQPGHGHPVGELSRVLECPVGAVPYAPRAAAVFSAGAAGAHGARSARYLRSIRSAAATLWEAAHWTDLQEVAHG